MNLKIWQLDPVNLTPYYNMALSEGLAEVGCQVLYLTSPFIYEDLIYPRNIDVQYRYFRGLESIKMPQKVRQVVRGLIYPLGHWSVLKSLRANPPDLLHIQWNRLPRLDYIFLRQVQKLGFPVVQTAHDIVPLYARRAYDPHLAKIYAESDAVIVHSQQNRADLLKRYPNVSAERVHVLPHLALQNAFPSSDTPAEQIRQSLNLPLDEPIFLFFGSFRHYKGLDILVEAFHQALAINPKMRLLIVGHHLNPAELPSEAILKQHPQHILLKLGFVPNEDVWKYHLAADAAIFPYRHIYQSGALLTAMGFGRAVIASQVGSFSETLEGNGWLVPPEDPAALAQVILEAAQDRTKLVMMGKKSAELIQTKYQPTQIAHQLLQIYQQVLA